MGKITGPIPGALAPDLDRLEEQQLRRRPGAKWRQVTEGVLPATVADMDFPVAEPIREALRDLTDVGDLGYPNWSGGSPLRQVFSERMRSLYDWRTEPGDVREFTNVTQGVMMALHLATDPGDGVAVHTPTFRPFADGIARLDRRMVPIPMRNSPDGWTFDENELARRARDCRALLLVNPHNPTGRVLSRDELRQIADVAERYDLLVVSDEIHGDLVYHPNEHVPFASLDDAAAARTVTLTSASKAFNLAGLRCAAAHVGPEQLRKSLAELPPELFGGVSVYGVAATIAAWTDGGDWLDEVRRYLDGNRRLVANSLATRLPEVEHHTPEATYLAWIGCRGLELGDDPAAHLRHRAGVALSSGPEFNPGGNGFARLNFATSRPLLREAIARLVRSTRHG